MKESIEIEFKNILTKNEYTTLVQHFFPNEADFFTQTNYYFETKNHALRASKQALRIRYCDGIYTATLKSPLTTGLLETDCVLTKEEAHAILHEGMTYEITTFGDLLRKALPETHNWVLMGHLCTKRAETPYKGGTLVLDESTYFNCSDYEVEYEVTDYNTGFASYRGLLSTFEIPERPTKNKVARFFEEYNKTGGH
ncbi:MAG: CYTH domain-containing protein [Bacilli bacterium]